MNKGFFVGECPFCKQGMQEILREKSTSKLFVECDECMVEWENPAKALKNVDASRFKYGAATDATIDEIRKLKWDSYVISLLDD